VIRISRVAAVLSVAAAGTLLTAGPALAQTAPAPTALFCPADLQNGQQIREADGSVLFCVEAIGAGAVVARTGVVLDQVIVAPDWTWVNSDRGSRQGKIDIRFANPTTGDKVEVRIQTGRTEVKGG
jgi:gentisate 1,2-dioxygenase